MNLVQSAGLDRQGAPRPLEGQAAVVTGSTSGIGLAIARALAEQGAMIVVNGFGDAAEIERLCREMGETHETSVLYDAADLSRPAGAFDLIDRSARALGAVDIIVNNAGIQHVCPIEQFPSAKWEAILAINLSAVFYTTQAVLPDMRRRRWGRIVNIASAHGLIGSVFKSGYVAAKHGVVGLTKVTALETAEAGITCNAVCPGYVWTPLIERQIRDQAAVHGLSEDEVVRKVLLSEQPNKRFATVEEIAGIVSFLCSPAAGSITGAAIAVDGGWTAH